MNYLLSEQGNRCILLTYGMLEIYPVGWGAANLLRAPFKWGDLLTVFTDGGSQPTCFNYVHPYVWNTYSDLLNKSSFKVWIVSHFDYDHFSIISSLLDNYSRQSRRINVDLCVLPYLYRVSECRKALMMELAIISYLIKVPGLPCALESLLRSCERYWLVMEDYRLKINDSLFYEFLWPPKGVVEDTCREIVEVINDKVVKRVDRENIIHEKAERFENELERRLKKTIHTEFLDIETLAKHKFNEISFNASRDEACPQLKVAKSCYDESVKALYGHYKGLRELLYVTRSILNLYSVAYAIINKGHMNEVDVVSYNLFHNIYGFQSNWPIACISPSRESEILLKLLNIDEIPVLYLADLDQNSLEIVLAKIRWTIPAVVIAPHHGNTWSDMVEGLVAYIHRCFRHVPTRYEPPSKNWRNYCSKMPCVLDNHSLGLRIQL